MFIYNNRKLKVIQMSISKQMSKTYYINIMEYFSTVNRNELLRYTATQTSEILQNEKKAGYKRYTL